MVYKNNFVVVIKCDGKILRESAGEVSLPFGSEYSILLKNADTRKALVSIEVDGKSVFNGSDLILDGNSSTEIKGFMKDMRNTNRFKFIHKTKEIQSYRGDRIDDGLIRVSYKFEQYNHSPTFIMPSTKNKNYYSSFDHTYRNNFTTSEVLYSCSLNSSPAYDEGITVKGSKVNQNYDYGSIGTLESTSHVIVLKLKGKSKVGKKIVKSKTVKTKIVCETCGRKNRSSNNFCYNCGTCLD
jgi:hypothetical protein